MKKLLFTAAIAIANITAYAQHEHHEMPMPAKQQADTPAHHQHDMKDMANMSHAFSLQLPMNRNGSGTAWLPDASPMYGYMLHSRKWMYMLHGNVFLRYNNQDVFNAGRRGAAKWDAPNWLMGMGQRKVGRSGLFRFSAMLSLDAVIAGGSGYPLLFQTGETWQGRPLIDRQHPHDLFSELSIGYTQAFSKKVDVFAYIGYPGEPALGSVAFMHRPSALPNPDAPLSHHWNDGTHITFGVATLGVRYDKVKLEASSFTGREPDEDRFNFDKPRFDSWSGRISYSPTKEWSLQASHGYVKSPEVLHGNEDVNRTTASAIYSHRFSDKNFLNATVLWGMNKTNGQDGEHAVLAEAAYAINRVNVYGRYEWVQKSAEELALDETIYGHHDVYAVNALTLGAAYDVWQTKIVRVAGGAQASVYLPDEKLKTLYGSTPMAAQVYLRIYPSLMR